MRWRIAFAGTAMQLALGAVYAWSVFRKPLAEALGASVTETNLAFTIAIGMLSVGAFVGGLVLGKLGPRVVGILAGVLYGSGTYCASFAAGDIYILYWTYGVAGFGIGLGYIVPIATLVKWFPDRRGLVTGIAVAGFGCGALAFGPVARELIARVGLFPTFHFLGIAFYVIIIGASIVLRDPPRAAANAPVRAAPNERTLGSALGTWQWYALWLLLFLNVAAGIAIIAEAAPMAQELGGASEVQAAALVGTIAVFNGAGRFLWSALSDALGRRAVFVLLFAIQAVVFYMLPQAPDYTAFLALCCTALLCYGGGFGTMPAFATDYFGARHVGKIYGLMLTAWGAGAVLGPMLVSRMRDATGEYVLGLQAIAGIMIVSSVIPLLLRAPRTAAQTRTIIVQPRPWVARLAANKRRDAA